LWVVRFALRRASEDKPRASTAQALSEQVLYRKLLDMIFSRLFNKSAIEFSSAWLWRLRAQVFSPVCPTIFCRGRTMNKAELVDHIAAEAELTKVAAGRALDALIDGVKATLKKGGSVTLVGFGTFAVGKRTARTGRNPRTGAEIKIKAAKVPKFRAGKGLKDALN